MHLLVLLLSLISVRAQQYPCSCSCCSGMSCNPTLLPAVYVQYCTLETCLTQCRAIYPQCRVSYPYGVIIAKCESMSGPSYSCRCDCCNTGSASCTPIYVGNSAAYLCQPGACSIACNNQYPSVCVASQTGQTQGTCSGATTQTSTTTTIGPWLGNTCSCSCCSMGSSCTPTYVGVTSASQCSVQSCTQACQSRFQSLCPSSWSAVTGQTYGVCISGNYGTNRCRCNCCGTNGCINYEISTYEICSKCDSLCRQQSPCTNTNQITQTCYNSNNNARSLPPWISLIFLGIVLMLC